MAREGWPIVAAAGLIAALALGLFGPWSLVAGLPALLFCAWFFRDPERVSPADPDALLCPADGRILEAGPRRVSVFMNVFDVHVCRAPAAGRVEDLEHRAGRFLSAFKSEASEENERLRITLAAGERRVHFTLVAGLIARRIVSRVRTGQHVRAGERIGLIRFGSRVDLELPAGARVAVAPGDRVRAGVTVLARIPGAGPAS